MGLMHQVRQWTARTIWALAVLAALVLAAGALLANIFEDRDTVVVREALDLAGFVAGPFDGLFHFYRDGTATTPGANDVPLEDLVNWGLGAAACLLGGRLLDGAVRPRGRSETPEVTSPAPPHDGPGVEAEGSGASRQSP
jgi:hypothetical protein